MKNLIFLSIACSALFMFSCNKDQAAVKKLDGSWTVTKMVSTNGGVSFDFIASGGGGAAFTFVECKLKKDEWCTGTSSTTIFNVTTTNEQVYRVTGDGTTLETKEDVNSSTVTTTTIDELTKTNLKMSSVDGNTTTVIEATKN